MLPGSGAFKGVFTGHKACGGLSESTTTINEELPLLILNIYCY